MKVSVVVPVYNPGNAIDDCVRTLLDQSMSSDDYEVIFVDDGSTDETPARLDALAAEHANVRVEHIPNSGWPGRPRNVGIEMARGEFVYFVDNDDWLGHEALERLYARAVEDDADVVIGKVVGHGLGKKVPNGIFRRNRSNVTFDWTPLLWLLTPHKLFRRALLDEHGIRFPEGRRRLEDHIFVVHAYFHARSISVLADYTCYHWVLRDLDVNASTRPFEPVAYYGNVREVLDLVDEHTEPGDLRDRLYLHWYRSKLLGRVATAHFLQWDDDYRRARYEEVRRLALGRFPARIDARLPLALRVRSQLLRDGAYDKLVELARRDAELRADTRLLELRRDGDELVLRLEAGLTGPATDLLMFERDGERVRWAPPADLAVLPDEALDVTDELAAADPYVVVRSSVDHSDFALPVERELELRPADGRSDPLRPVLAVTARVSPREGAAGAPLPAGDWQVVATPSFGGFKARGAVRTATGEPLLLSVGADGGIRRKRASLRRRVAGRLPWLARAFTRARRRVRRVLRR